MKNEALFIFTADYWGQSIRVLFHLKMFGKCFYLGWRIQLFKIVPDSSARGMDVAIENRTINNKYEGNMNNELEKMQRSKRRGLAGAFISPQFAVPEISRITVNCQQF